MNLPVNLMEAGPNGNNLAVSASENHPVDDLQRRRSIYDDLDDVRRIYGSGLAMRLATERQMASKVGGRLPGMDNVDSSNIMLETLLGTDTTLEFQDFLSRPEQLPVARVTSPHKAMEQKLGLM
jgi:Proteasome maturation factor UMP1